MNNITLKKIAGIVGCSISTVSRALKHHPDISVATRERIIALANSLDYEPNAFAVHLRTKHSNVIGLMVPFFSNHFYESFIASVEEECRKNGFTLMILQTANDPKIEMENLKLFRQNRVTGLFVCVSSNSKSLDHYEKMKDVEIPVVFFDNVPNNEEIYKVCMADERAAIIAAEAIQKTKKKKILALFGDLGLKLLKPNSNLCYIATNNWVTNAGASNFRNIVIKNSQIVNLTDFGAFMIFENASIQTMIMLFKNTSETDNYTFDYRRLEGDKRTQEDVLNLLAGIENENLYYLTPTVVKDNLLDKTLTFNSDVNSELLDKIKTKHTFFKIYF